MSFPAPPLVSAERPKRLERELLVAARDGRISFAKPRARRWLRHFFPRARARSHLPQAVCKWLASPVRGRALKTRQGQEELIVRMTPAEVERLYCVVLEVRPQGNRGSAGRGLTAREADVLDWLAQGKSNGQIATILGCKSNTVAKHLRSVFDKMGVDNRGGANAFAWQRLGGAEGSAAEFGALRDGFLLPRGMF